MKKLLQLAAAVAITFSAMDAKAQLPDGSIAPNWTLTDINGNSHDLYTYLDQGKVVFIDVSATWCGPCWNYHTSGNMDSFYNQYGPSGTNQAMFFFIEGDGATDMNDLNGTDAASQGDWITGTPYPIINPNSSATTAFNNDYDIAYFPTIYMICPNRIIKEVGQITAAQLAAEMATCPAPASQANDPALLSYSGATTSCGALPLEIKLQNNGTSPLTAATIVAMDGANQVASVNWTGNLATYDIATVTVGTITVSNNMNLTFNITSADQNTANNTLTQAISMATPANSNNITIALVTDRYGSETTWKVYNSSNAVVAQGGPYGPDLSTNTTTTQTPVNVTLPQGCYRFEILDSYGDGICCAYGAGSYTVSAGANQLFTGGQFLSEEEKMFNVTTTSVNENDLFSYVNVFPNPVRENAYINIGLSKSESVKVSVYNVVGEMVYSIDKGEMTEGDHQIDVNTASFAAGVYMVKIETGSGAVTKKITVSK